MTGSLIVYPGNEALGTLLEKVLSIRSVKIDFRKFPDGESYVKLGEAIEPGPLWFLVSLNEPDHKILPLIFAAEKARETGAGPLILIAPYLAYMRQDKAFKPGEAVTNKMFASLIGRYFDHLITLDPHLHRIDSLDEIYSVPSQCLQAAPSIAQWIQANVTHPLIIGPDSESKQWVQEIAEIAEAPYCVFSKQRLSDQEVHLQLPDLSQYQKHTPVLVDDIISTAGTMIKAVSKVGARLPAPAVCIGIHAIFSGSAYERLKDCGAGKIVTTNSIKHHSNQIDIAPLLGSAVRKYLVGTGSAKGN